VNILITFMHVSRIEFTKSYQIMFTKHLLEEVRQLVVIHVEVGSPIA